MVVGSAHGVVGWEAQRELLPAEYYTKLLRLLPVQQRPGRAPLYPRDAESLVRNAQSPGHRSDRDS